MEAISNRTSDTFGVTSAGQWRTVLRNIRWIWRMIYQNEPGGEQLRCVTRLSLLLKRVCLHGCNHEKIHNKYKLINIVISNENDSHNANAGGGNSVHVNMVATSTAWSNLSSTRMMNTSMLWPMTRVYSRFSGCDTVGCSAKGKQHLCQQWSNGEALGDVGVGVFGDDGTDISMVTTTRHSLQLL